MLSKNCYFAVILVIPLLVLSTPRRSWAQAGTLDPAFGDGGVVTTGFLGSRIDFAESIVVVQPDGKLIVGGRSLALVYGGAYDFALARYNTDGTLDETFGVDGLVTTDFDGEDDEAYALALQPDGKIVVVGHTLSRYVDIALARYNADGSLDQSFGTNGLVMNNLGGADYAHAVAIQTDGRIVVAGYVEGYPTADKDFILVRHNADGSLDTSFGSGGQVLTDFDGDHDQAMGVGIQADGKIVAVGEARVSGSSGDFAIARYNADGSLDPAFGSGGLVTTDFGTILSDRPSSETARAMALLADGKILAGGSGAISGGNGADFNLARYNPDGSLDVSFGSSGLVTTDFGGVYRNNSEYAYSLATRSDGRFVLAGHRYVNYQRDFAVAGYNADGTLDLGFGTGGLITTDLGEPSDLAYSVAVQTDDRIVVAGASQGNFAVVRYNADGSPDPGFGIAGIVKTDFPQYFDDYTRDVVVVQADGKIVVAGRTEAIPGGQQFALLRLNADGTLDSGFGVGGLVKTNVGGIETANSVAMQTDGKIVVAGMAYLDSSRRYDFIVLRYNPDGTLDDGFGEGGKVATHLSGRDDATSAALQDDGKIVVAGYADRGVWSTGLDFAVVRYNTNGTVDNSFTTLAVDFGVSHDRAYSMALQDDGKIVVAGYTDKGGLRDFALARYNLDGTLDHTFDSDGRVTTDFGTDFDFGRSVAVRPDGKIIVGGYAYVSGTSYDFAVACYNEDGSLDETFGAGGIATTNIGPNNWPDYAYSVVVDHANRIVLGGHMGYSTDFALVRYNADGSLDDNFGNGGIATADVSNVDYGQALAIQPDGHIVMTGWVSDVETGSADFAVLRFIGYTFGQVAGVAKRTSDESPLPGVTVALLDEFGLPMADFDDQVTDEQGKYRFDEVPEGTYQVSMVEPLGYFADGNPKAAPVIGGETTTVDFGLTPFVTVNEARSKGYWKHQFDVYLKGKGNAQETHADLLLYLAEVELRYTSPHFQSLFADMADGMNDFEEWQSVLTVGKKPSMEDRARAQLAAMVLNVMSLKIAQYEVVTADGRDVGDVVTYASQLLENVDPADDELAKDLAEAVNNHQTIAGGVVPDSDILYKTDQLAGLPETFELNQNYPNPFNPSTIIAYALPEKSAVKLSVFDLLGREVRVVESGVKVAGRHAMTVDAADLSSGTYLYRLQAGTFVDTKRMVVVK